MSEEMFEGFESLGVSSCVGEPVGLLERIVAAGRVENRASAAQLVAVGELFAQRVAESPEDADQWAMDTMAATCAEVGAGLRISQGRAETKVHYARVMRERLPKTAQVFCAGDIDLAAFATIASRTDLIEDTEVLAQVDALIAANVTRWPSLSRGRLGGHVDWIVARMDADALRRRQKHQAGREIVISDDAEGICLIQGSLATPDARALDERLTALAATVCPHDPRTRIERRADALGALAAGADRLGCRCARTDCISGQRRPAGPVTIHVIAESAALGGAGTPSVIGADSLVTADLVAELAVTAKQVPLTHPGYSAPEPGYRPSAALADFVRARDLTCRWPGCDVPATHCDIDHSIPHADGGPTHAANLNSKCRSHHLVKTFWGWREQQLPDGTLIFTSPAGDTHVTTPGSALLFPNLCAAVGGMPTPEIAAPSDYCGQRTTMMPKRRRTRSQDRAYRVAVERRANHQARTTISQTVAPASREDSEPPPF